MRSLMFADFINSDSVKEKLEKRIYFLLFFFFLKTNKNYEEVASLENLYGIVENQLGEYNNMHKAKMNLVIFR